MIDRIRELLGPQQRRIIGAEAKQALENKHWNEAFDAVHGYLIDKAKSCDPTSERQTAAIVISLQLLEAVKREMVRKIEDGEMARIEIEEVERRNRPLQFRR